MLMTSSSDGGFAFSHLRCVASYKATRSTRSHRGQRGHIDTQRSDCCDCNGEHGKRHVVTVDMARN